jgi:glycosyltransferase involved in cell wall biosynthesis
MVYNLLMPKVSVLMPCYNAAATLEETLSSIAAQRFTDYEVLMVDDGSEDGTRQIMAAWEKSDPRFRLLALEHAGIIPALNKGLHACRAEYIARMDADDRMHPQRLAKQAAFLDTHQEVALVSSRVSGFPQGKLRQGFSIYIDWLNSLDTHDEICRQIFVESPLCHPSVTFRKQVVQELGGYQERGWAEDYDLWLRIYLAGKKFAKLPEVLLEWREHPARLTRTDSRYSLENFLRAKAHYLSLGPLRECDGVIVWGAGMHGRRIGKQLEREGLSPVVFVDIDPKKIGSTRRGKPIIPPAELLAWWARYRKPAVLAAVGARGARELIRKQLNGMGLIEGKNWWGVA